MEFVHLNAAVVDDDLHIQQYNQVPIRMAEETPQHLAPAIRHMVARNRTRAVVDTGKKQ